MSMKLSVGLSKKIGLPNDSSVAASCQMEADVDDGLLTSDLFHDRVRQAYSACARAIQDELARQQGAVPEPSKNGQAANDTATAATDLGRAAPRPASQRQLVYLAKLAATIKGMDTPSLAQLAQARCGCPLSCLSSADASLLITSLKQAHERGLDLKTLLEEDPHDQR